MTKTAIVTDSNSGIIREDADRLGIFLIPMPFFIDEELFFEGINLSHGQFYTEGPYFALSENLLFSSF